MNLLRTMATIKITKREVDTLPAPAKGQAWYFDKELKGFGICVGQRTKTYFAQRDINGRTVRVTIGRHGVLTPETARRQARTAIAEMGAGKNPNQLKKANRAKAITLGEAYAEYLMGRKELRASTRRDYNRVVNTYLSDWKHIQLARITKEMVTARHRALGERHGHYSANGAMRVLRAVYNFAKATHDDLPENPVSRISLARTWYREERRRHVITPHELRAWYEAVISLRNETARDYLRLLLFTGLRRSEAARLRWEHIDLVGRTLTIIETKNREPLVLPLSDFVTDLLRARQQGTPWVFPGSGKSGHYEEPKTAVKEVIARSGVEFTPHDLRRTFVTIAESLDIPAYALKRLLNHKTNGDVTSGYIVLSVDRLRRPMQKITDYMLENIIDKKTVV